MIEEIAALEARVRQLESERDALLNALAHAVEIITGQMPIVADIRRRFLETGEVPAMLAAPA